MGSNIEDVINAIKLHDNVINSNKLPMSPCKCIVPKYAAKWNLKKGGSNLTTKTLELCPVIFPVNSAQSDSIDRDAMTFNTNILREYYVKTFEGKKLCISK